MITIIHGDDIAASRNFLNEVRQKNSEVTLLNGEGLSVTDLMQIVDGGGLFTTEKIIFIENFYSKRKTLKEFDALVTILKENTLEHEIILWEGKELDKKSLSLFGHATVKTYKLPQTLFLFLDSLKPKQGKNLVQLYQKVRTTVDSEMVFFMLIRQVRLLLALSQKSTEQIDEVKRLAPWQINKLQKQAALFTKQELVALHTKLYVLDNELKTGQLPTSLTIALDILLIDI
jgi:hypothetical protein